ncbi:MAG: RNA polymerase sigma factor [Bacteroidales bacterium]|nr:RNA polymerase sigma factor [Bacteroidales bacterium]
MTELDLLKLARSGNPSGTRKLYERYVGYLTAVCSRYVVDKDQVKDIMQEAFIKIFNGLDNFEYRGEGSLKAWASRIVVNDSLKALKASSRLVFTDQFPDEPEEDLPSLPNISASTIQDMIKGLPDGYRAVFNLYVFEKKSHKEIASMLGIKEDSSASQYFRARNTLAKSIKAYLKEHE